MPKPISHPAKGGPKGGKKSIVEDEPVASGGITGTDDADSLVGTEGNDTILGLGGDDTLNGWTGFNWMDGGEGSDLYLVYGRGGLQSIDDSGANGHDVIAAGTSSTSIALDGFGPASGIEEITANGNALVDISGTSTSDVLDFSETVVDGIYMINGMAGDDVITGSDADDLIAGGADDDWITGGLGVDTLVGGTGADTFGLSPEDDSVDFIRDFYVSDGDRVDLSAYAEDPAVVGWDLVDSTTEDGQAMATLQVLYDGGGTQDVAHLMGVTEDQFDDAGLSDSILLF